MTTEVIFLFFVSMVNANSNTNSMVFNAKKKYGAHGDASKTKMLGFIRPLKTVETASFPS